MEPTVHTTAQLRALRGWGPAALRSAERDRVVTRVRRGNYHDGPPLRQPESHRVLALAAASSLGPDTVVSHLSAASLHGLPVPTAEMSRLWVTRTVGHADSTDTLRAFHAPLESDEITTLAGLRITTLERTVVDIARTMPFEWGVAAMDAALRLGMAPGALRSALDRGAHRRGMLRARRVVTFADARAESPGESVSRALLYLNGPPAPDLQVEVLRSDGLFIARADFGWLDQRVLGEFDGAAKYRELVPDGRTAFDVVDAERARERELRDAGWDVVRWGWRELKDPPAFAARVRRALQARGTAR